MLLVTKLIWLLIFCKSFFLRVLIREYQYADCIRALKSWLWKTRKKGPVTRLELLFCTLTANIKCNLVYILHCIGYVWQLKRSMVVRQREPNIKQQNNALSVLIRSFMWQNTLRRTFKYRMIIITRIIYRWSTASFTNGLSSSFLPKRLVLPTLPLYVATGPL